MTLQVNKQAVAQAFGRAAAHYEQHAQLQRLSGDALLALAPESGSLVFVENVGNLVCPALFDIGEHAKAVVISVTEGNDKPIKYPHMFAAADVVVVNKTDLLPYVDLDLDRLVEQAHSLNPAVTVLPLSVRTGEGLDTWLAWLQRLRHEATVLTP